MYCTQDVVKEKQVGELTVKVVYDFDPSNPRTEWDNMFKMVCFHKRYNLGDKHNYDHSDYNGWGEMKADIIQQEDVAIIQPLYLYDHSGITISTSSFNDRWDSGQVGFIFISKEDLRKETGKKRLSKKVIEQYTKYLEGEVETYDEYLRGEVYGFQIEDSEGEVIDSCYGFFGGSDYCLQEGVSMAEALNK